MGEMRLDAGKMKRLSASARQTGLLDSCGANGISLPLPKTLEAAILARQPTRNRGNVGLKQGE
jgi:hypothetical protein